MYSKCKRILVTTVMGALLLGAAGFATHAAGPTAKTPEQAIKVYYEAAMSGKVDQMVDVAKDSRFDTVEEQKDFYSEILAVHKPTDFKTLNTKVIDSTHEEITVRPVYPDSAVVPDLTFIAYKENNGWKLEVQPVDINRQEGSPDFGKVTPNKTKIKTDKSSLRVQPEVDVLYWKVNNLMPSTALYFGTFGQTRSDSKLLLKGYQEFPGGVNNSLYYEIIKRYESFNAYYDSTTVSGQVPQSGAWFERWLSHVPYGSGYSLRLQNKSEYGGAYAAGNGYE